MSAFPVKIGPRGTSNARVLRSIKSRRIPYPLALTFEWRFRLRYTDFTPDGDTAQVLTLNTLRPSNAFPTNVRIMPGAGIYVHTAFDGTDMTAFTVRLGDTNDDDGLLTDTDIEGAAAGWQITEAAAEWESYLDESAYSPLLTIATTGANIDAITQGDCTIVIPFRPLLTV